MNLKQFDREMIGEMHHIGVPLLRITLGIIFLWFGALKVFGVSPVVELVEKTFSFLPGGPLILILGIVEVIIGIDLLFKFKLLPTLIILWIQMAGTLLALVLEPSMFFQNGNVLMLTTLGEFIIKNFVLIAASIVVGGYEIKKPKK